MSKRPKPTRSGAEGLAVAALAFVAQEPERLRRFLDLSGLDPANLRQAAAERAFWAGFSTMWAATRDYWWHLQPMRGSIQRRLKRHANSCRKVSAAQQTLLDRPWGPRQHP
jgi:hypothetical protein